VVVVMEMGLRRAGWFAIVARMITAERKGVRALAR
jgi:hypothetical protein